MLFRKKVKPMENSKALTRSLFPISKNTSSKVTFGLIQDYPGSNLNFKASQLKMKQMATDLIHSVGKKLNPEKKEFSFELFGLDFMLDDKLDALIIEANSNPCIEVEGNVLGRVIPSMLENMMRVAIDPVFPPPYSESAKTTKYSPGNVMEQNKFTLVYDSLVAGCKEEEVVVISK
jgi:tubulin monoglycylase TTLL3/8